MADGPVTTATAYGETRGAGAGEEDERAPVALRAATREFLKALASPTRQRIMLLFARGASSPSVAERVGIGQPTASQQLALPRRGGIVTSRRDGKIVLYRSDRDGVPEALADLQAYLQTC